MGPFNLSQMMLLLPIQSTSLFKFGHHTYNILLYPVCFEKKQNFFWLLFETSSHYVVLECGMDWNSVD